MLRPSFLLLLAAGACAAGPTSAPPRRADEPPAVPVFSKPFAGHRGVLNVFDHDLPIGYADDNGRAVDWRGRRTPASAAQDGHRGYDFDMPQGTPVLAAGDGVVVRAGAETARDCPLLAAYAPGLFVQVEHVLPDQERIATNYAHLSRVDVREGQTVTRGEQVGLSGNTGCSTRPHLHFGAFRRGQVNQGDWQWFDPSGWSGPGTDPWRAHPKGALSTRLWRPGEAPAGL